jgi:hypothetical protein
MDPRITTPHETSLAVSVSTRDVPTDVILRGQEEAEGQEELPVYDPKV